jgi:hypothetical protein
MHVFRRRTNPALQLDALRLPGVNYLDRRVKVIVAGHCGARCERVFTDEGVSGATVNRPALQKAIAALKLGDALVVWKLDRLGRSPSHLIALTSDLTQRGIGFESLSEPIAHDD